MILNQTEVSVVGGPHAAGTCSLQRTKFTYLAFKLFSEITEIYIRPTLKYNLRIYLQTVCWFGQMKQRNRRDFDCNFGHQMRLK